MEEKGLRSVELLRRMAEHLPDDVKLHHHSIQSRLRGAVPSEPRRQALSLSLGASEQELKGATAQSRRSNATRR